MSWLFSRALAVEYSEVICLHGEQFAQSNVMNMPQAFLCSDRMTGFYRLSRFGMTFGHSTEKCGEAVLMSFLADFPAKPLAQRLEGKTMQKISGRKCDGSWQMSLPNLYSGKTYPQKQSTQPVMTLSRWVTPPTQYPCQRQTWVQTTFGNDIGFLHTPTTKANYSANSMQKWSSARAFVTVFGRPTPSNQEWMMGWPIGWTDIRPLETGKFQTWLSAQFSPCAVSAAAAAIRETDND